MFVAGFFCPNPFGATPKFIEKNEKIGGNFRALDTRKFSRQPNHHVHGRQFGTMQAKILAGEPLDDIASHRALQILLTDDDTQAGTGLDVFPGEIIEQEEPAANRPPKTKNG